MRNINGLMTRTLEAASAETWYRSTFVTNAASQDHAFHIVLSVNEARPLGFNPSLNSFAIIQFFFVLSSSYIRFAKSSKVLRLYMWR
jgi:hypothetical protein